MIVQIPVQAHPKFSQLKSLLAEIEDLHAAAALLYWDQTIYMPPKGIEARARQLATLDRIAHEKFTDGTIADLLEALTTYERVITNNYDRSRFPILDRFVAHEPLRRVHECTFGVLALESEPIDPRL
jgi:Zn-dependent M32 family carboxypeptidase